MKITNIPLPPKLQCWVDAELDPAKTELTDKMTATKPILITDPIYSTVYSIFHCTHEQLMKFLTTTKVQMYRAAAGDFVTASNVGGRFLRLATDAGDSHEIIYIASDARTKRSVVYHECFHAASKVLQSRGLELTDASEEAFAYYQVWLAELILEKIGVKGGR
jgi:hypothetical protein